jgi:hypothetical protein
MIGERLPDTTPYVELLDIGTESTNTFNRHRILISAHVIKKKV